MRPPPQGRADPAGDVPPPLGLDGRPPRRVHTLLHEDGVRRDDILRAGRPGESRRRGRAWARPDGPGPGALPPRRGRVGRKGGRAGTRPVDAHGRRRTRPARHAHGARVSLRHRLPVRHLHAPVAPGVEAPQVRQGRHPDVRIVALGSAPPAVAPHRAVVDGVGLLRPGQRVERRGGRERRGADGVRGRLHRPPRLRGRERRDVLLGG
mmetsp:Transcript_19845/g.44804  ORF Transcript_19845/g.44804 Transcript_19845/m.44804 type:complete len:208 (+) Transcript_19845:215-838(+)